MRGVMTKTWLSVVTALVIAGISGASLLGRWYVLGLELHGPRGASTWKVTLAAAGKLRTADASLTQVLPPDFRHQHIFDETFQSKELLHRTVKGTNPHRREVVWRRADVGGVVPFRLSYSFRCLMGMRRPTAAMGTRTRDLDAAPASPADLRSSPQIESESPEITEQAREVTPGEASPLDQVHALFEFVVGLENEPTVGTQSALECLRSAGGDPGGKSRLLVALCRNRGIPARLVTGLILEGNREQGLHTWAEAWVHSHWVPLCPTYNHFGSRFPRNYLVLALGDDEVLHARGADFQLGFLVHDLRDPTFATGEHGPATRRPWQFLSLYALQPGEQNLVKFLLLLPVAALIVSIFRTLVGVPTFGTFGPALLGLVFLDLQAIRWGPLIFVGLVLAGWGMRRALDRFHLLMVPRLSILLTGIVLLLLVLVVAASFAGVALTQYVALFPLVILTHLVERFWTVEAEDSTAASFKTLAGTLFVSAAISLALAPDMVTVWLFRYPEILGFVLALQFLLGRYTGYRLLELYRFRDLAIEEPVPGGAR